VIETTTGATIGKLEQRQWQAVQEVKNEEIEASHVLISTAPPGRTISSLTGTPPPVDLRIRKIDPQVALRIGRAAKGRRKEVFLPLQTTSREVKSGRSHGKVQRNDLRFFSLRID